MKKLLVLLVGGLLLVSGQALAKGVTFDFSILSSGPDIYPCNAGLRHRKRGGQVCRYLPGSGVVCTNDSGASDPSGDQSPDYMRFSWGYWNGVRYVERGRNVTAHGSTNSRYNQIFGRDDTGSIDYWDWFRGAFGKRLRYLSFNLTSERYGAEFFVDICYKKTQIRLDDVYTRFLSNVWVQATDLRRTQLGSYTRLAGLQVAPRLRCTLTDSNRVHSRYWTYGARTYASFPGSGVVKHYRPEILNWGRGGHPNMCVVRFYFREANTGERLHQLHTARVRVHARITEDKSGGPQ